MHDSLDEAIETPHTNSIDDAVGNTPSGFSRSYSRAKVAAVYLLLAAVLSLTVAATTVKKAYAATTLTATTSYVDGDFDGDPNTMEREFTYSFDIIGPGMFASTNQIVLNGTGTNQGYFGDPNITLEGKEWNGVINDDNTIISAVSTGDRFYEDELDNLEVDLVSSYLGILVINDADANDWSGTPMTPAEIETATMLKADIYYDCRVDGLDLVVMAGGWLAQNPIANIYIDGNDIVNLSDFAILANEWYITAPCYDE